MVLSFLSVGHLGVVAANMPTCRHRSTTAFIFLLASLSSGVVADSLNSVPTDDCHPGELVPETCNEQEYAHEVLLLQTQLETGVVAVGAAGDVAQAAESTKSQDIVNTNAVARQKANLSANVSANVSANMSANLTANLSANHNTSLNVSLLAQHIATRVSADASKTTTTRTFPASLEPWERDYVTQGKPAPVAECPPHKCTPNWLSDFVNWVATVFEAIGQAFVDTWHAIHRWLGVHKPTLIALITALILLCALSCIYSIRRSNPYSSDL